MLKLETSKGDLYVNFQYTITDGITEAWIMTENNSEAVAVGYGYARCAKTDTFNHRIGRKVALLNAMKDAGFEREERKNLWSQFFTICKRE